jgi:hypothetical protein
MMMPNWLVPLESALNLELAIAWFIPLLYAEVWNWSQVKTYRTSSLNMLELW